MKANQDVVKALGLSDGKKRHLRLDKGYYCDAAAFDSRRCDSYMTDHCLKKCGARKRRRR